MCNILDKQNPIKWLYVIHIAIILSSTHYDEDFMEELGVEWLIKDP